MGTAPLTNAPGALASAWCMGVSASATASTNTTCTGCFNWGTSAKAYNSGSCTTAFSTQKITDCDAYNPSFTDTASAYAVIACYKCAKTYFSAAQASSGANFTYKCSDSKGTGCTGKIDNCRQTMCYSAYSTVNSAIYSSQFCQACKNGYLPANNDIWNAGALKCEKGKLPENCKAVTSPSSQFNAPYCWYCNKNFAMSYATGVNQCVGFTTDENCQTISTSDEGCMTCFSAYYFSGSTCTQSAYMIKSFMTCLVVLLSLIYY